MDKSIDWSEWILQKNNEAKQEELKKSESVYLNKGAAPAMAPPAEGGDGSDKPKKGQSVFTMDHVNQVAGMKNHGEAKQFAHGIVNNSTATDENKKKIRLAIERSRSPGHLAQTMANHVLAHPGEGLRVIKGESLDKAAKDMVGDDVDSSMLMSELESMAHHIEEIKEHLSAKEVAPDWVKAKVSKSASSLSDVAHYVMGVKEHKK